MMSAPAKHLISADLRPEAEQRRLERLVERIAVDGLRPGESVPARVMRMVADFQADRLSFVAAELTAASTTKQIDIRRVA